MGNILTGLVGLTIIVGIGFSDIDQNRMATSHSNVVVDSSKLSKEFIEAQPNLLSKFMVMAEGTFRSNINSIKYSGKPSITRHCVKIWTERRESNWMYCEDALTDLQDEPFGQWVYNVTTLSHDTLRLKIYQLPEPSRFSLGWVNPKVFNNIRPNDLIDLSCPITVTADSPTRLKGKTIENCNVNFGRATSINYSLKFNLRFAEFWTKGFDSKGNMVIGDAKNGDLMDRVSRN